MPLSYFGKKDLSDLTSTLINDVATTEHTLSAEVPQLFGGIISGILVVLAMFGFNVKLSLAMFSCLPVVVLVSARTAKGLLWVMGRGGILKKEQKRGRTRGRCFMKFKGFTRGVSMNVLNIAIVIFIVLESANITILYFFPESKFGNGIAVFNEYFNTQKNENSKLFVKYLVNWVAGTKLIFIALLLVVLFLGNDMVKIHSLSFMCIAVSSYYFMLHPILRKLDQNAEVTPKGYSKVLFIMITGFIAIFILAIALYHLL